MKRLLGLVAVSVLLAACSGNVDVDFAAGGAGGTGGSTAISAGQTSGGLGGSSSAATGSSGTGASTNVSAGTGGVGASGSTGAGGGEMVCPGFGDACTECVSTACPSIFCACSNNAECLALSACLNNCNDDACQQKCQTAHPDGISDIYLLSDCAGTSCPGECPGNQPLDDCTKCVLDTCPEALNACLADPECVALYQCLNACGNVDLMCQQGCYAAHGAGTMKLQTLLQCETMPCGSDCQ